MIFKIFNKTSRKFLGGFALIVIGSMIIVYIASFLDTEEQNKKTMANPINNNITNIKNLP
ncbi:hypothetical protein A2Z61_00300 [Candidatus Campbellbacteria bacterium RIFCSPLOWO2_02_35_12]|uniref:Uncharacterized protein n=1 Tax=Candidatus Campbellbacteria bacterium RIFCSPLOWO2_02_35_12 TaxID=1797580 RepID=A0A1F5EGC9_9BACT|nr:MAG: hypothetical protein A2Z61_00300 [Candidatus Campbellbacteria bacterium RIFCSPLOWO2_02_35_12]